MRHRFAPLTLRIWLAVIAMMLLLAACPGGNGGGYERTDPSAGRAHDLAGGQDDAVLVLGLHLAATELLLVDLRVQPAPREQLLVRSLFDDPPPVQDEDHIGRQDRRETVGDRDRRPALHQRLQRRLHQALGGRVQRRRGLVQDQDLRILQDHSCDREALLLPAGQFVAALPDDGVIPIRELQDPVVDVRRPRGRDHLLVGRVRLPVEQVAAHRVVEQVGLLRDDPDRLAQ